MLTTLAAVVMLSALTATPAPVEDYTFCDCLYLR